jgi:signal transduction histidine kinase
LPDDELRSALHDRLGPGLANLEVRLELLEVAMTGLPLMTDVAALKLEAGRLVSELRRVVHDEPPALLGRGLIPALAEACRGAGRPGLRVVFRVAGTPCEPAAALAELLYRAALDGIANGARHADASRCSVTLRFGHAVIGLQVRDDGVGPAGAPRGVDSHRRGLGLASLRRSARLLGGAAHLLPAPTGGSCLSVTLPLPAAARTRRKRRSRPLERRLP